MQPQDQNIFSFSKILFAGILTLVILSIYTYFFPQKPQTNQNLMQQDQSMQTHAPITQMPTKASNDDILVKVKAKNFDLEIDTLGRIRQVYLKEHKFLSTPQESIISKLLGHKTDVNHLASLPLFDASSIRPLEVRFADSKLNQLAFETPYTTMRKEIQMENQPIVIELIQTFPSFTFKKKITLNPDLSYSLALESTDSKIQYFLTNGARPIADSDHYAFLGSIIANQDEKLEKLESGDVEGIKQFKDSIFIAGVDRYFTSVLYSKNKTITAIADGRIEAKSPIVFVDLKGDSNLEGYIGPKNYQELKALYPPLGDLIEYGLITFFAKPVFYLLEFLYDLLGNWGWAIVLLTIIVRLVLFPLSYRGMIGMQKLKDLAPEMKEIQAKYKTDPQKMQKHMMDLYRKHGANPLGGCLPLLLQIPVFFAIYKVLYSAVELKSAPWILWIVDLSVIDPYYVLPLIMGITMYISQILTPSSFTDPTQEKVFKLLPVFFTIFFIIFPFPAGLVLYWSVNNVISIFQQILINKIISHHKKD